MTCGNSPPDSADLLRAGRGLEALQRVKDQMPDWQLMASANESVGGAGDEDTGHGIILPSVVCDRLDASSATGWPQHERDNLIWLETSS